MNAGDCGPQAAAKLHTSQPAVSKQLKLLEQALGVNIVVQRPGVQSETQGEVNTLFAGVQLPMR